MKELDLVYSRHNFDNRVQVIPQTKIWYYDLTILVKGTLEYTVNGKKLTMKTADAIFLPPDTLRARKEMSERSDYISFNFTTQEEFSLPQYMENIICNDILLLIALYDEFERKDYFKTNSKEKKEHLLINLLLVLADKVKRTEYNPLTLKIIEHIHTNMTNKITLEEIGRITFFSPVYCDAVFKRDMGRSIIDYLLEERINESKKLLVEGAMSLSEVSESVGFDDYNYFSRVFKKRTGYTPREYYRIMNLWDK